jgi:hypothetical protein
MRFLKQFLYGLIVIVILAAIGAAAYKLSTRKEPTCLDGIQNQDETGVDCGGSCVACEVSKAELKTGEVLILPAGDDRITLFTEVKNPERHGAFFEYQIDVFGSYGGVPKSVDGASFVSAGSRRYVVLPGVSIAPDDAKNATITMKSVKWDTEGKEGIILLELSGVQTVINGGQAVVVGNVVNKTGEIVKEAKLTVVLFGADDEVINASSATIKDIGVLGEVPFKIYLPVLEEQTLQSDMVRTRVYAEVVPEL